MIEYVEKGTENAVHVLDTNVIRMSPIQKGDKFYVPKKPIWLVNPTDTNPNARARVLVVEILDGGHNVKPIYYSQLCRVCRKGGKLAMPDGVNTAVYKGGNKAFDRIAAGRMLTVKEVNEDVFDYKYDESGRRETNENGSPIFTPTKAYSFTITAAANIKDAEMQKLVDEYMAENFTIVSERTIE